MSILIVEDEVRLAEALGQIMNQEKYAVDIVHDGAAGLDYELSGYYDVIVLDIMLPKKNGFEVVNELRAKKITTPVILLTAKDEVSDKVTGLDYGADDYMTKPFAPEELLARIRALSRRQGDVVLEELTFADLTLNLATYTLSRGPKSVRLGNKEYEVLKILMTNSKMVVPKEDLIIKVCSL
jgi:DNA-binding response OmpR family regulator